MTDFRALCEELVDALKDENTYTIRIELIDRARAALAEQPVEPTDDSDLLQFLLDNFRSRSLHMDGTAYYVLDTGWPFNHRSSNSRAFVEQAYHKSCEHFRKQS